MQKWNWSPDPRNADASTVELWEATVPPSGSYKFYSHQANLTVDCTVADGAMTYTSEALGEITHPLVGWPESLEHLPRGTFFRDA